MRERQVDASAQTRCLATPASGDSGSELFQESLN